MFFSITGDVKRSLPSGDFHQLRQLQPLPPMWNLLTACNLLNVMFRNAETHE